MRWSWTLGFLIAAHTARAEDARDVFGFSKKTEAPRCDAHTLGCVFPVDAVDAVSPAALHTWLDRAYLFALPVADATHDDVAHFATGATRDGAGAAFGGATGLENAWTIEGAPVEDARTGGVETRVPLTFLAGIDVTAGGFAARDRAGLGGAVDVELRRGGDHHVVEAHAWVRAFEAARTRPIAAGSYQVRRVGVAREPEVAFATVASGPLGDAAWYAAGVAGTVGTREVRWQAARLVDADQDGAIDGLPGQVALDSIATTTTRPTHFEVPVMARVGGRRGAHDVALTLLGSASRDAVFLANATLPAAGIERTAYVGDAIARWQGTWPRTRARAILAWHGSAHSEDAYDRTAASEPQLQSAYVPSVLPQDPALAGACNDAGGDDFPLIPNCPVPFGFFASGGPGVLVASTTSRPAIVADVAHQRGHHVVRAGVVVEDTRLVTRTRFSGGELVRSLAPIHRDREQLFDGSCEPEVDGACDVVDALELTYRTRYTAAYLEDTFEPAAGLRVDAGVRWELMWVGPTLHFSDAIAPRLAVAYDAIGGGRSRLWASLGRTHALLPAGMGASVIARPSTVRDVVFGDVRDRNLDRGAVFRVAEDVEPVTQDEVATGAELGVIDVLRVGVWLQARSLRRGLETVLANPNTGEAFVDNPGRRAPLEVPATRETRLATFDVVLAPAPALAFRASLLWGDAQGTWTGPFDPRQGANLYAGTDWDLDATNLDGRLPASPGHRVALEAAHRGALGTLAYTITARVVAGSGRPRDLLGDGERGLVHLLPRGAAGRMPVTSQTDLRVAARWRGFDVTLDVRNAFDRQAALGRNELYAGGVAPVAGGSFEDLVFVKSEACGDASCSAVPANRRTAYGLPTTFQPPRAFVLGIHRAF